MFFQKMPSKIFSRLNFLLFSTSEIGLYPCCRPKSGSMLLYSRKKVRYRRDGYCWKKRKDGKTTREDHMKLKVQGTEVRIIKIDHDIGNAIVSKTWRRYLIDITIFSAYTAVMSIRQYFQRSIDGVTGCSRSEQSFFTVYFIIFIFTFFLPFFFHLFDDNTMMKLSEPRHRSSPLPQRTLSWR